jgi:hypothetical protein
MDLSLLTTAIQPLYLINNITLDTVLYVIIALLSVYIAVLCYFIGKTWGKSNFWYIISFGFIVLALVRIILLFYNLNNQTSDIFTLTILLVGFSLIAIGQTILYKTVKEIMPKSDA